MDLTALTELLNGHNMVRKFPRTWYKFFWKRIRSGGVAPCLQSRDYKGPRMILVNEDEQRKANRDDKEIWEQE